MSDNPITRDEMFLSAAAGNDVPLPEPVTRQERFLKAIADHVNNGGSSAVSGSALPAVTSADVGAGLAVIKKNATGAVIVPEQTTTYDEELEYFPLTNTDASLFVEGVPVLLTVDMYKQLTIVGKSWGGVSALVGSDSGIVKVDASMYAMSLPDDTCTIKCEIAQATFETIVPEQTVTTDNSGVTLDNVSELFSDNMVIRATINGSIFGGVVYNDGIGFYASDDEDYYCWSDDGEIFFSSQVAGDYTIKLEKATPVFAYEWGIDQYAGYDFVLKYTGGISSPSTDKIQILKGSIEDVEQKIANGEGVRAILYQIYRYGNGTTPNECLVYDAVSWDGAYSYIEMKTSVNSNYPRCTINYNSAYLITNISFTS